MPLVVPTPVPGLPTPPTTTDSVNFDTRADAFNSALQGVFRPAVNALADTAYANAQWAADRAGAAGAQATAANDAAALALARAEMAAANAAIAAAAMGAVKWVSGTVYPLGFLVWSPVNLAIYRRLVAGAGAVDPSADGGVNWGPLDQEISNPLGAGTVIDAAQGKCFSKTITANTTFTWTRVPLAPISYGLMLRLKVTAGVVTWPAGWVWPANRAPTLTVGKTHLVFAVTEDGGANALCAALLDYPL